MSQTSIADIIKTAKKPMHAEEIMQILTEKGEAINEKSFYANISKIEKDKRFGFKDVIIKRTAPGKVHTFPKREWFYKN